MTEKQYGGSTSWNRKSKINQINIQKIIPIKIKDEKVKKIQTKGENLTDKEKILKAGKITSEIRNWIQTWIKKDILLLDVAEKIENKIIELGGKPAFPVNTSINEIAAHYTPSYNDTSKTHGLIKIDFGVQIDGWCADNSLSIDLENSEKNKKMIEIAKKSLDEAIKIVRKNVPVWEIGKKIQTIIESNGFSPIVNLSGHNIEKYKLHSGITIPNIDDGNKHILKPGIYAIEPFVTDGAGKVKDGKPSGIYMIINPKTPRSQIAREILEYASKEYNTLPFCSRWLMKKFGNKTQIGLKQLEDNGNLHHFKQLIEISGGIVAQAEHTLFIEDNEEVIVTTA